MCSSPKKRKGDSPMDFSKYENKVPYPKKPSKPRLSSSTPSISEIKQYQNDIDDFEVKEIAYKSSFQAYQDENVRLKNLFKQDLFDELGISNHPKKEEIFEYAKENGSGLDSVFAKANEIVEFFFKGE
jgi:hypothetical protein